MKKRQAFTLIELLAVIVILAIILAIAVPSITGIINSTTKSAMESDAKLVLKGIEYKLLENDTYDITTIDEANIESELGVSDDNYSSVEITKENNVATIVIVGKNKWANLVAYGTIGDIKVVNAEDYNGDITKPVITMLGTSPVSIDAGSVYSDAGATALDDTDGNVTANIVTTSTVNVNVAGTYTVTYNVSDAAGNAAIPVIRTVNVVAVLPTVTTSSPAINITSSGATVSGEVTSSGGSTITERGIVYGTSANPTISDNKVVVAGTTGSYSGNLTGLTANTTYHARTYATNSAGTNYGTDITFTTGIGGIDQYTVLMLHMDGSDNGTVFTDDTGKTVTRYGDTMTKTATKIIGTASGYFDGSGDYLSLGHINDLCDYGTNDFTIDFHMYINSWFNYFVPFAANGASGNKGFYVTMGYDNAIIFNVWNGSAWVQAKYTRTLTTGQWYHFAFIREGSSLKIYEDGVLKANQSYTGSIISDFNFTISGFSTANYLNGYMDEFRISKGIARWTSNFTPPTAPYTE